jgi:hypothetical protein
MNVSIDELIYIMNVIFAWMNFIYELDQINKSSRMKFIHDWNINKFKLFISIFNCCSNINISNLYVI